MHMVKDEKTENQLSNDMKYKLLEIDLHDFCRQIQKELFTKKSCILEKEELEVLENAIGDCTEVMIDTKELDDDFRYSFYSLNHKLIVIKCKKIDVKILLDSILTIRSIVSENVVGRVCLILKLLYDLFYNTLDEDVAQIYAFLCYEFFVKGRKYDNVEIYDVIQQNLDTNWSTQEINKVLEILENEYRVIEFVDGILYVKDKIHFT